jgi:hypothetical protein
MAYERGKKTWSASNIEEVVAVGQTRRLKPAESIIVMEHVFASLKESAKSFKAWDDAWAKATADGVVRFANKFKATARDTYLLSVPECLIEQRAMRDMRDAFNGRTKPRGVLVRICKCPECRRARAAGTPRA